jgi:hypothetical protein
MTTAQNVGGSGHDPGQGDGTPVIYGIAVRVAFAPARWEVLRGVPDVGPGMGPRPRRLDRARRSPADPAPGRRRRSVLPAPRRLNGGRHQAARRGEWRRQKIPTARSGWSSEKGRRRPPRCPEGGGTARSVIPLASAALAETLGRTAGILACDMPSGYRFWDAPDDRTASRDRFRPCAAARSRKGLRTSAPAAY